MDSTNTSMPVSDVDRAGAHFRVGAAATGAFLALLLLLLVTHGSAEAERTLPVTSPAAPTTTVQPEQSAPDDSIPDFRRGRGGGGGGPRGNGPGFGGGGGDGGGGGIPDGGGGGTAPA